MGRSIAGQEEGEREARTGAHVPLPSTPPAFMLAPLHGRLSSAPVLTHASQPKHAPAG